MFEGKNILITGATGSWGNELVRQLLDKEPNFIIVFSRGELAQVEMQRKFKDKRIKFVIGDVRDYKALESVFAIYRIDYVYHLAALKHVPICENQPQEAIKTNIDGTINLINLAIKYNVRKVIDVSTDKACAPTNLYGLTKAVGEKLIIQANCLSTTTDFVCVRGGNVLGTNGSVVPLFIEQICKYNEVTITDGSMTRFFLTLPEAIELLFNATRDSIGGEIFVMNMPSFSIDDLADVIIDCIGYEGTTKKVIGAREGEKKHEVLVSEYEALRTYILDTNYYVIKPDIDTGRDYSYVGDYKVDFVRFSSADNTDSKDVLKSLLRRGGLI